MTEIKVLMATLAVLAICAMEYWYQSDQLPADHHQAEDCYLSLGAECANDATDATDATDEGIDE